MALDCPFPGPSHRHHIFDIHNGSTNNFTDFPGRVFSTRHSQLWSWLSTSIWATLACLPLKWVPLPTICLVWILHMACPACSRQSPWGLRLDTPGCFRQGLVGVELVFLQDVLISRASTNFFLNTVPSLPTFEGSDMGVSLSSLRRNLWGVEPGLQDLEPGRGFHCLL